MTSWPQPTRKDHETFCQVEEWRRVRDARGRTGTHHVTFELDLLDGRILRARSSHPVDRSGYGQSSWRHVLRDQLEVDEAEFWPCVHDGVRPARGTPEPPTETLPADLVHLLTHVSASTSPRSSGCPRTRPRPGFRAIGRRDPDRRLRPDTGTGASASPRRACRAVFVCLLEPRLRDVCTGLLAGHCRVPQLEGSRSPHLVTTADACLSAATAVRTPVSVPLVSAGPAHRPE
ncbi:hypothetical protein UA75_08635 [Actinoalloteichus sp. GBA129-24]|uniref:Cytotoxic translational repressor of toxin-antitoxin stability system n=1 Tax=Actinoalloteichus fjordicus TaxID=1612552 RepID=A0AAC9L9Y6_9PSEU|nr:hypothetical protein UA74_08665 [Actinoalloteichus fjordicus]APU19743.1 hypothetical protein UA75_08635 [Actinoalloteichus sp. GBA129-24]